ncbi:MAG: twin-arginine translocase subunit TatC [Porphyromonadaceae bacterium]|nr:twin-arginine translocase subunit TatC [Porphyromonadaceae bacterium]
MSSNKKSSLGFESSFWDHLEVLRWTLLRSLGVLLVLVIVCFGFKDFIFNKVILPPLTSEFHTYRFLCFLADLVKMPGLCPDSFQIQMINITLSGQFMTHMISSLIIAVIITVPYLLYEAWKFVKPALYPNEKKSVGKIFLSSSFLFYLGAAVSYFVIFPFTLRFLGTYQVSETIVNQISIQSYMNTLALLVFFMGIAFELPVVVFLLSQIGLVNKEMLRKFRKYSFVGVLILAAFITPTTDPFTMLLVATPLYLLYELSIVVSKEKAKSESADDAEVESKEEVAEDSENEALQEDSELGNSE